MAVGKANRFLTLSYLEWNEEQRGERRSQDIFHEFRLLHKNWICSYQEVSPPACSAGPHWDLFWWQKKTANSAPLKAETIVHKVGSGRRTDSRKKTPRRWKPLMSHQSQAQHGNTDLHQSSALVSDTAAGERMVLTVCRLISVHLSTH